MLQQRGFTLLEAIVSLVIIASVGVALLDWVNTNLTILQRIQLSQQRIEATQNTLIFMEQVNPTATPNGMEILGNCRLRWESHVVEPLKDGVTSTNFLSLFQVGLYDTTVTISLAKEGTVLNQFTLRQLGYEQVRKYDSIFDN